MKKKVGMDISFPSDGDYIPAVRKFVAEAALIEGFSQKFSYRTEIIIDELCNNAVKFGPNGHQAGVKLVCEFGEEDVHLSIQDQGGKINEIENLREAIKNNGDSRFLGRGLEIVKMLASKVDMKLSSHGETVVRVVKQRSQNIIDTLAE